MAGANFIATISNPNKTPAFNYTALKYFSQLIAARENKINLIFETDSRREGPGPGLHGSCSRPSSPGAWVSGDMGRRCPPAEGTREKEGEVLKSCTHIPGGEGGPAPRQQSRPGMGEAEGGPQTLRARSCPWPQVPVSMSLTAASPLMGECRWHEAGGPCLQMPAPSSPCPQPLGRAQALSMES